MDVLECANVGGNGHARVGDFQSGGLGFPNVWQTAGGGWVARVIIGGKLDKEERHFVVVPKFAPPFDQGFLLFEIKHSFAVV